MSALCIDSTQPMFDLFDQESRRRSSDRIRRYKRFKTVQRLWSTSLRQF